MQICVPGHVLGTSLNLMQESEKLNTFTWCETIPDDAWVFDDYHMSIGELSFAINKNMPTWPPAKYENEYKALGITLDNIKWQHSMPKRQFKNAVSLLLRNLWSILESDAMDQYVSTFKKTSVAISTLQPAKINVEKWKMVRAESSHEHRDLIDTFAPNEFGFASITRYTRKTSTGRVSVASGPQILRLPKKFRDIIESRFENGNLVYADYNSLEPRTLLSITEKTAPDDVYTHVSRDLLKDKISRETAKIIVMGVLYGAGIQKLRELVSEDIDVIEIMSEIKHEFGTRSLEKRLTSEFKENGYIKNYQGRILQPTRHDGSGLLSYYVQSSGADAALTGFANIIEEIKRRNLEIIPIFIIHDAVILDVHPNISSEVLKEVLKVGEEYTGLSDCIPLRTKSIQEK
jgi:hypothetical protein